MKKIIIVFAAVLTLIFSAVPTYAAENGNITGVYALKGKLFYYDTPTNKMVLTGVSPVIQNDEAEAAAKAAEYTELRVITAGMFFKDKNPLSPEWVNNYADREVWFVVSIAADGSLSVPYLVLNV